jgi:hypothetical protein
VSQQSIQAAVIQGDTVVGVCWLSFLEASKLLKMTKSLIIDNAHERNHNIEQIRCCCVLLCVGMLQAVAFCFMVLKHLGVLGSWACGLRKTKCCYASYIPLNGDPPVSRPQG